jgi:hypothetical protein
MGIGAFIASKCTQTCVYWGNPQEDGYGTKTYDAAVEIACRWEDVQQIVGAITTSRVLGFGEVSRARVFVTQDIDEQGVLYFGTLSDLTAPQLANPKLIETSHIIKRFEKVPAVGSTTEFLRIAYLTPWLT